MSDCLTETELDLLHGRELSAEAAQRAAAHLAGCESCTRRNAALAAEADAALALVREAAPAMLGEHSMRAHVRRAGGFAWPSSACGVSEPSPGSGPADQAWPAIPGYDLLNKIHRGSQGIVFEALQRSTRRRVAVKVLCEGFHGGRRDRARFDREVRILAQLRHPHIVTIHDSGVADGHYYIVMDLVDGPTLDEWISRRGLRIADPSPGASPGSVAAVPRDGSPRRPEPQTHRGRRRPTGLSINPQKSGDVSGRNTIFELFAKVAHAVDAAHRRGIVHRDLKPTNIRVDAAGEPRVLDFGLAKILEELQGPQASLDVTMEGQFIGTLAWASPEQAEGCPERIDPRSDVYALGVMLYHALAGRFPYDVTGRPRDVLERIQHVEPAPLRANVPGLDEDTETIVLRCLNKDPDRRYQTGGELARDLDRYLCHEPIEARRDSALYVLRKRLARHRAVATLSTILCAVLLGFAVVASGLSIRLGRERDRAVLAERTAVSHNARADDEAERLRQRLYYHSILLAQSRFAEHLTDQMLGLLDGCPADLRAWEWRRLRWMADQTAATVDTDARSMALSADGDLLAIGGGGNQIRLVDTKSWAVSRVLTHHDGVDRVYICSVALSRDGRLLASAGTTDRQVHVWDLQADKLVLSLRHSSDGRSYTHVALSPDGARLAYYDARQIRVVTLPEGRAVWTAPVPDSPTRLMFSSSGDRLLALHSGSWAAYLHVHDAATGQALVARDGIESVYIGACFFPDGRRLLTHDGSAFETVDAITGKTVGRSGHYEKSLLDLAVSPDGRRVACGTRQNTVEVRDVETGDLLAAYHGHVAGVDRVAFLPDSRRTVSLAWPSGMLKLFDPQVRQEALTWSQPGRRLRHATFSPDGRRIAVACTTDANRATVQIWNASQVGDRPLVESAAWPDDVFTFALFSPDGRHVLTDGRQETSLHLWDADTGELVRAFDGYQMGISSAMFFPDGRRVMSSSHDKTCMTWDVATGRKLLTLSHPDEVWEATVSHDGRWILSGCRDGRACLWDAETGRLVRTLSSDPPAPEPQVDAVAFSPDDRWMAVGHYHGCLRLWSRETGELLKTMTGTSSNMYSAVFTPDGRRLLTGGKRVVEVWDVRTGEVVYRWDACKDPSDSLYGLVLSPDGARLLTSRSGDTFSVWPTEVR